MLLCSHASIAVFKMPVSFGFSYCSYPHCRLKDNYGKTFGHSAEGMSTTDY